MNQERWQRLKEVFSVAIECTPQEREQYITHVCGGDAETETDLRALLREHEAVGGFLDRFPTLPPDAVFLADASPTFHAGEFVAQRFRIVTFLGRGGMGEVYEAYDTQLRESVALKTIRPEFASDARVVEHFKREVSRARKIASPHVCRVYDLFSYRLDSERVALFLTMELLPGESLSERLKKGGRLDAEEALPLIRQMGEGLAAAHAVGIVHQDLKSSNVMLVPSENGSPRAVITDFGLAHQLSAPLDPGQTVTAPRLRAGTPAYMAPEQVEGGPITSATDLYSLGIVAYEMITGRLPFQADTVMATAVKRLKEKPTPPRVFVPDLDPRWEAAILRCLERDPRDRFSSAVDLVQCMGGAALPKLRRRAWRFRQWAAAAALLIILIAGYFWIGRRGQPDWHAPPNSVAVLPFVNLGEGPASEYFSDGVTEELIHTLTNIGGLEVKARESSFRFKGTGTPLLEVARQLGVRGILSGSLRRASGQIRIIVRLVNAPDGIQLWSEEFERPESELFTVQKEIATAAAKALQVRLAQAPNFGALPPANSKAHEFYLEGRFHLAKRSDEALPKALETFERALAADPGYAAAHVGLADTLAVMAERDLLPSAEGLARAKSAALRALTLDPRLADAYVSLGHVTSLYDRNFHQAEQYFLKALELNPNLTSAQQWYSYMLLKLRRFEEAIRLARQALRTDPFSLPANSNLAVLLLYMRDNHRLVEHCRKMLELDPGQALPHLLLAHLLARQARAEEAYRELDAIRSLPKDHRLTLRTRAEVSAMLGLRDEAQQALHALLERKRSGRVPSSHIAIVYASLGQTDLAFDWLERAYAEYDAFLSLVHVYPAFDSLRSDPRYLALLTRLGITERTGPGSTRTP